MIETFNHSQRRQADKNTNDSSMIGMAPTFANEINNSSSGLDVANATTHSVFGAITDGFSKGKTNNNDDSNNHNSDVDGCNVNLDIDTNNGTGNGLNTNFNSNVNVATNNFNPRLKRSSSNTYNYVSANFVKRRLPNQEEIPPQQTQFLDSSIIGVASGNQSISIPNTPSKAPTSRRPSLPRRAIDTSSISNNGGSGGNHGNALGSPYHSLPNVSATVSNVDLASKAAMEASVQKLPLWEKNSSHVLQTTPSRLGTPYFNQDQHLCKGYHNGISVYPLANSGDEHNDNIDNTNGDHYYHRRNENNNTNANANININDNTDSNNNKNNNETSNNDNSNDKNDKFSSQDGASKLVNAPNFSSLPNTNINTNFDANVITGSGYNGQDNQSGRNFNGNTNNINNNNGGAEDSANNSGRNNGNNNNNNNDNNGNRSVPSVVVPSKRSSQALVQKLQDIYKIIVKQEIELQERCSQLTISQTTELKNLWTIYKINSDLINNYVTFLTTALLPSQSEQDVVIGEEIVEIYRIERRLWVYGTITFLDVLKNFSNFMDPEVCCQFITHVFISISNMLGDIPPKYGIPWLQRLGDLSRMAIALYPSGFIDWKLSAEHWYMEAMKFTYGHGKLYYHMSTVQQNTLEAFVNLGKSVFCQDTFIPSQQYMQLVIDNIYQRAFVERNNGNHRNTQLIEYLKHSEVMLLPSFLESVDLQQVVLIYFKAKFGCDSTDANIFDTKRMFCQNPEYLKYFFRHGPAFAESHILQLIGFGDPKNPFALLFELPKFLKDRRDKKEKKRTKSTTLTETSSSMAIDDLDEESDRTITPEAFFENIETLRFPYALPCSLEIWNESLKYINMTSLQCSMIVLQKFLRGPLVVALPHFLPWSYFLISLAYKIRNLDDEFSKEFWIEFVDRIFPWNTIVSFLNVLMAYMLDNSWKSSLVDSLCEQYSSMSLQDLLEHFNHEEVLPEIWKCWGTLWFDNLCNKDQSHVEGFESVGIGNPMFLDSPVDGITFDDTDESGENFWKRACRTIFLFKGLADNFSIGVTISPMAPVYCRRNDVSPYHLLKSFSFKMRRRSNSGLDSMDPLQLATGSLPNLNPLKNSLEIFEQGNWENTHDDAIPMLSVIEGESIFDYPGYRRLHPDYCSYDKNGEFLSASLYTSWYANNNTPNGSTVMGPENGLETQRDTIQRTQEMHIFNQIMEPGYCGGFAEDLFLRDAVYQTERSSTTYFVLDTTTWLRHFGHIYKLASNGVLKFAICLTTFHELRFLRKPKDENVVEAATRAIITVRQLYSEGKILPLRFTGNVATHIEEHLEYEEKITWRSHVDEFVIEAVAKAQSKFQKINQLRLEKEEQQKLQRATNDRSGLKFVVLVTDDSNMRKKAQDQDVRTFSTKFAFSLCNSIGLQSRICTN